MYSVIEVNSRKEAVEIAELINKYAISCKAGVFGNPEDGWCVKIISNSSKIEPLPL